MHNYDAYLPDDTAAIRQWEKLVTPVVDVSAELIADRMPKTGRLLDVGCGFGFFMERMWRAGWSVEGIEVSATGRCYARQRWGFDIHPQPLEELALAKHRYDVVTLFYVIEHVDDPIRVLKTVNSILKPGGLVLLRWPHTTPIVKLLRPWAHRLDLYHTPYHLYDFSPTNMTRLLELTGFSAIETVIGGHTHPNHRLSRWATTAFGRLAQALYTVSKGRWLLPGVSKTTLARS
jgi:2-polyprenyl-3-methyl-5-hydroxy-6-metoxy-1,4-benzoquinol methylase